MSTPDPKGIMAMQSLGKATAFMLIQAGVENPNTLRRIGAVEAWRRIRMMFGKRVTASYLYALEAAVTDTPWNDLKPKRVAELKMIAQDVARRQGDTGRKAHR